ncbi:MAG: type II toxin-antitoxin system VapC family toxin [Gemmatales bacterium]
MKLLLDTHVFLWYITADVKLPVHFKQSIQDSTNEVYLSAASVWEAVIKHGLGKLPLPSPPALFLPKQRLVHGIEALPIDESAMIQLASLPVLHRDPFDRMLVAQALQHGMTLVTVDPEIRAYPVPVLALS